MWIKIGKCETMPKWLINDLPIEFEAICNCNDNALDRFLNLHKNERKPDVFMHIANRKYLRIKK